MAKAENTLTLSLSLYLSLYYVATILTVQSIINYINLCQASSLCQLPLFFNDITAF